MSGDALALAARELVGAPYRHGGRDPASGLDCLGVVAASFAAIGWPGRLPARSTLRRRDVPDAAQLASRAGLICTNGAVAAGDILLVRCSSIQLHLLIAISTDRFVHAHAGLRRVVLGPGDPTWTLAAHWRLPPSIQEA
jgi:cell wall-associated NlpC family hydrolase